MMAQACMWGASACYVLGVVAYVADGKPWMATTLGCYALSAVTLWMAGTK